MSKKRVTAKIIGGEAGAHIREVKVFVRGEHVRTIVVPAGQSPQDVIREQFSLSKPKAKPAKKVCPHLGPVLSFVKNELCGCANKQESIYQCQYFNLPATTTQYKVVQPELCCIGCAVGPFSADF